MNNGLNPAQQDAVEHTEGPLLVLAGAGSGKTRVITFRILHLIEKGVAPKNILAVTFTNKAAKEMRERVVQSIRDRGFSSAWDDMPTVTTFHSFGVRVLRQHHEVLGLPKHFAIYDRGDTLRAVKKAVEKAGHNPKEFEPKNMLSMISKAKGDATTRADYKANARSYGARIAGEIWEHYEDIMRDEGALDFDDLLVKTLNLLKSNPDILKTYHDSYRYIHVDEFQDTNKIQMEIVQLLAAHQNICVVGDVDQSIYSWRGANIANILKFEQHFNKSRTILLEENYRSTKTIIEASNAVIAKNSNRPDKRVFTNNAQGDLVTVYTALNGYDEANYIAKESKKLIDSGVSPSDVAVLYRTNSQSRSLEEGMIKAGVPYQLLGTKFFERAEVKDILSYLRLALNPGNGGDLARIINVPTRGIGKVTYTKLVEEGRDALTGKAKATVDEFYTILEKIAAKAKDSTVSEILKYILEVSGMEAYFLQDGDDGQDRLENIGELVSLSVKYDEFEPQEAIERLLEEAALQSDQDEIQEKEKLDAVRLMTIHASKGLEFPYVFIAGMEEGLFPHKSFDDTQKRDDEEERRLFYVALTRAGKKIYLTHAFVRMIFGSENFNDPSSFIGEIPGHLMEQIESKREPSSDGKSSRFGEFDYGNSSKGGYNKGEYRGRGNSGFVPEKTIWL